MKRNTDNWESIFKSSSFVHVIPVFVDDTEWLLMLLSLVSIGEAGGLS